MRRVDENVVLDQKLSTVAGINSKVDVAEVVVVKAESMHKSVNLGWVNGKQLTGQFRSGWMGYES